MNAVLDHFRVDCGAGELTRGGHLVIMVMMDAGLMGGSWASGILGLYYIILYYIIFYIILYYIIYYIILYIILYYIILYYIILYYEHVKFAGSDLWILLQDVYHEFFESYMIPETLKSGIILPLLKGKGAKANNKDNYRGITSFPTLCKIFEMISLNRLDNIVAHKGFFSEMQFGFQEGVGCTEAPFTILETINHMLERGSKVFSCFLDVRKAFDTVWIDGILYKLFSELGIGGRM